MQYLIPSLKSHMSQGASGDALGSDFAYILSPNRSREYSKERWSSNWSIAVEIQALRAKKQARDSARRMGA